MRFRKGQSKRHQVKDYIPIWTPANADLNTALFLECLAKWGITDVRSYFLKLRVAIVLCVIIGAIAGAIHSGLHGLIVGALLGLPAPAVVIWLVITVIHVAIYLAVFCAAWVGLYYLARWFLRNAF